MTAAAPLVVAIDGPAGAGKSTLARRIAERLGWAYLDTGAMYRALTLEALERGLALDDADGLAALAEGLALRLDPHGRVEVGGRDLTEHIRSPRVDQAVSHVAALETVRGVMVEHQRAFARQNGRIVAEGRDIGSVVFPDAAVKVYLDARPQERARRRLAQGSGEAGGVAGDVTAVQQALEERDRLDRTRAVAPLRRPEGAWRLDTSDMTPDEVFGAVLSHVRSRIPRRPGSEGAS